MHKIIYVAAVLTINSTFAMYLRSTRPQALAEYLVETPFIDANDTSNIKTKIRTVGTDDPSLTIGDIKSLLIAKSLLPRGAVLYIRHYEKSPQKCTLAYVSAPDTTCMVDIEKKYTVDVLTPFLPADATSTSY